MTLKEWTALEIWELAKNDPHGIGVSECDLEGLKEALERVQAEDPELQAYTVEIVEDRIEVRRQRFRSDGGFREIEE